MLDLICALQTITLAIVIMILSKKSHKRSVSKRNIPKTNFLGQIKQSQKAYPNMEGVPKKPLVNDDARAFDLEN